MQQIFKELEKAATRIEVHETSKLDSEVYHNKIRLLDLELDTARKIIENHENHFSMVENYVEKYAPIAVQK